MLETFQSLLETKENKSLSEATKGKIRGTNINYKIKKAKGGPIKTQFGEEQQFTQEWYYGNDLFATVTASDIGLKTVVTDQDTLGEALNDLLTI